MFKFRFKTIAIAALLASLLLTGFVVKSEAASITSLWVSAHSDGETRDGGDVGASLSTDEDVSLIYWEITDKNGNIVYSNMSMHNAGTRSVWVNLGSFTGAFKGEKYTCEAIAWFFDEDEETWSSDDDTDDFRVYYTKSRSGEIEGLHGSSDIYSITYDGSSIGMSGSIYGYNTTNWERNANGKFRITVWKNGAQVGDPVEQIPTDKDLDQGDSYYRYGSPSKFIGWIGDDEYSANAYARVFVGAQTWKVEGSETFTRDDN
ncbi:MAG: hypothetical protein OXU23_10815 [Candidatus Poribacteria bacterium]|nr:hypothetical protein [Candidatus Poribacteria bacterium]